jgi:hypothetical protein
MWQCVVRLETGGVSEETALGKLHLSLCQKDMVYATPIGDERDLSISESEGWFEDCHEREACKPFSGHPCTNLGSASIQSTFSRAKTPNHRGKD